MKKSGDLKGDTKKFYAIWNKHETGMNIKIEEAWEKICKKFTFRGDLRCSRRLFKTKEF